MRVCSLAVYGGGREIATEDQECTTNQTESSEILHAINLPILKAFYNLTDDLTQGKHLFPENEPQTPEELQWRLFADRTITRR